MSTWTQLDRVNSPEDLAKLSLSELEELSGEIRQFLIEKVSATGGHLGPNLGVVELTLAIHRVFNSPQDAVIFDTGHQAYVHKIVTGRKNKFDTLRQENGLSGYPSRAESPHDWVESSHASASLSYADGLSRAFAATSNDRYVVAVIGDGALTGGMAWEALNNIAARPDAKLIVVVNDNGRSFAETIGGFAQHLSGLRAKPHYEKALKQSRRAMQSLPFIGKPLYALSHGIKVGVKDMLAPQRMFSDLGLKYIGPVDGHDLGRIEAILLQAKQLGGPVIVHLATQKGRGFVHAENHTEDQMHSTGKIDPITGESLASGSSERSWTSVFSEELISIGHVRHDLVAITAAMPGPTGLLAFGAAFPERMIDVGIAEQHALTCAAGLALGGLKPVVAIYSTFLNRAFDQLLMDVALLNQPVMLVLDRAGVTGNDGASHNGMWDLSLLAIVPGIRVAAPRDEKTLRELLQESVAITQGPSAVRFPKGTVGTPIDALHRLEDGVDVILQDKPAGAIAQVLLIASGPLVRAAREAALLLVAQGVGVTVVDPRWVYPVPASIIKIATDFDLVVTVEDNGSCGGFGSMVSSALRAASIDVPQRDLGINQEFLHHADRDAILQYQGLTPEGITGKVRGWLAE